MVATYHDNVLHLSVLKEIRIPQVKPLSHNCKYIPSIELQVSSYLPKTVSVNFSVHLGLGFLVTAKLQQ